MHPHEISLRSSLILLGVSFTTTMVATFISADKTAKWYWEHQLRKYSGGKVN